MSINKFGFTADDYKEAFCNVDGESYKCLGRVKKINDSQFAFVGRNEGFLLILYL